MVKNYSNTKALIFNTSLRLFATDGFDFVSIRTIANTVGIKAASIYNHYSSKEKILEACYDYYLAHRHITRLKKEQYKPILEQGTKDDILKVLTYEFHESIADTMILSLIIIFSRIYNDNKAKKIFIDEINSSMEYLHEFFIFGIKNGRFDDFNVPAVSLAFLNSRLFSVQLVNIEPEQQGAWAMAEKDVYHELLSMVPFKY